jgi:transposase
MDLETPMVLPIDMRQVETMKLPALTVNRRGSGSRHYPPPMMLALGIYCCTDSVMSPRRIERATYRDLAVRHLTGDTHLDHDTNCAFRRKNAEAVK